MLDLQIETIAISALRPWKRNARTHSKKQIRQIADSIETFGFTNAVLIDAENTILAGQGDVWFIDKPARNDLHPTMKPVALVERAIRNSSKSRDIVLDPFGGSGSTLIACEKPGRQARLIELDSKYVDTIILRWQEFSGGAAILDRDGRNYGELATGRAGAVHPA